MPIQVIDGTLPPEYVDQGIPYDGCLAVDLTSAVDYWHQGLPFTENGRIAVSQELPVRFKDGAAPMTADGRLAMAGDPDHHYSSGIPYTFASLIAAEGLVLFIGVRITVQPVSQTVIVGDGAVFTITAISGNGSPLTYQWQYFDVVWVNFVDAGAVSGSTTDTLTIDPTTIVAVDQIRCIVDNDNDSQTSNVVTLTVLPLETYYILTEPGDFVLTEPGDRTITEAAP
jgi:hypothetical protein